MDRKEIEEPFYKLWYKMYWNFLKLFDNMEIKNNHVK